MSMLRHAGYRSGRTLLALTILLMVAVIAGVGAGMWQLAGLYAAIVAFASLSALSILDKSMEYIWYKTQFPSVGAATLWLFVAVGLGVLTGL